MGQTLMSPKRIRKAPIRIDSVTITEAEHK